MALSPTGNQRWRRVLHDGDGQMIDLAATRRRTIGMKRRRRSSDSSAPILARPTGGSTGRRDSPVTANIIPTTAIGEADGGSLPSAPGQGKAGRLREVEGKWEQSPSAGHDSSACNFTSNVGSAGAASASSPPNHHRRPTGEPPPPPIMSISCLLVPLVVAGWWYWTKNKARKVVALLRYQPKEGRVPDAPATPGDGPGSPGRRGDRNSCGAERFDDYHGTGGDGEASRDAYSSWHDVTCHESLDENQRFVLWFKGAAKADDRDRHASLQRSQRSFLRGNSRLSPHMQESMLNDESGDGISSVEDDCSSSVAMPGNRRGAANMPATGQPHWDPIEDAIELSSIEVTDSTVTPWSEAHEVMVEMAERDKINSAVGYWGGGMPLAHLYDVGPGGSLVPWHGVVGGNDEVGETDSGVYATCDSFTDEFVGKVGSSGSREVAGAGAELSQQSPASGSSDESDTFQEKDDKYVV